MLNFKNTASYIWPIVRKYKWEFYLLFFFACGRILMSVVFAPVLYKKIIDLASNSGVDKVDSYAMLMHHVWLIALTLAIGWVSSRLYEFFIVNFQSKTMKDLYDFAFAKLHQHSYLFFADNFSGSLVNKSRKFVRAFETAHDVIVDNFWGAFITLTSMLIVFSTQTKAIAILFIIFSVIYIGVIIIMSRKRMVYEIADSVADSKVIGYLSDSITNVLAVKSSSAFGREFAGFKKYTAEDSFFRLRSWRFGNNQRSIQSFVLVVVHITGLIITSRLWMSGQISAGVFILFQSYMVSIAGLFWELGRSMTRFTKAISDMSEMVDILKKTPDVLDAQNLEVPRIKEGNIEIKDMNFRYGNGTEVFENFSLQIKPGEKVGLVGHSGSGKSTITKLLMRFLDISSGEVLIDGQDIRKIKQDDLRRNISYIPQEPILFHRTIRENISYSWPEASDEQIMDAAQKAHAHEFISSLPLGYDTLVGERGVKLSGGERQRVAIARAMLKPAPILILDEATSSLDSISESYIQDAFGELMKGKTTIVIAHRLSTIQKMDRIIVLDKGKIVEEGTHQELLEKNGFYADLWNHQTGGFLKE